MTNVLLGNNALGGSTGGPGADGNIAIGDNTGINAGPNSFAVLIGHEAGKNSAGSGQVAIGAYALHNANSGALYNIAIGLEVLRYLTSGVYNTVIGWGAAIGLTTGSSNTAVGHDTLKSATTGSRNVAMGKEALYSNNINDAVGIGYQAGFNAGSNSIAIGSQAGVGNNRPNSLFIGNTTPLIYGELDTKRIVLGGGASEGGVALLINSTDGGLRIPRLTSTQEAAIAPSQGTIIYNTTLNKLRIQSGGVWKSVAFE